MVFFRSRSCAPSPARVPPATRRFSAVAIRRCWALAIGLAVTCCALASSPATAPAAAVHKCHLSQFASGALIVRGITCRAAATVVNRALARPGCRPSAADARLGRGCYGTTRFGLWVCSGLFPGEGFDLRCRSGARRIHASAGG
jgi:hypothetical protein